jgi:endonuclease/exonuclease/phosphatase family metal-dependent hydrolase
LDDGPALDPPLAERLEILRPQLLRLKADVVCLQEVNAQRTAPRTPRTLAALDRLIAETPYADFHRAAGSSAEAGALSDKHNLVILSRYPLGDVEVIRHGLVPPAEYRIVTASPASPDSQAIAWDRPILKAAVELPGGRRLHVVNLHLRSPLAAPVAGQKEDSFTWRRTTAWAEGFFMATVKRAGQALEARLTVDRVFDAEPDALIAVCGDFNAEERETPLRILRADVEDTGNGRLAGRVLIPMDNTIPESHRFSVIHQGHRVMLDHVLISRRLLEFYRHVEIHNEALGDEAVAYSSIRHSPESYHAPVVAEFELPERG